MRATLDGHEIFIDNDAPPAYSLSVDSIIDPSSVRGSSFTTIKAKATKEAMRVLGGPNMAEVNGRSRPLLAVDAEGSELVATAIPTSISNDEVELLALGNNASWFEHAKSTKLKTFDFGNSLPIDASSVAASWTDAESFLYFPLIDFGSFEDRDETYNVLVEKMRPAFRWHRLINEAIAPTGYRFEAKGQFARDWKKIVVMQPSDSVVTPLFRGNPNGVVMVTNDLYDVSLTELGSTANPWPFTGTVANEDPAGAFDVPYFVMNDAGSLDVCAANCTISFNPFDEPTDGQRFYLHVYDFTDNVVLATTSRYYTAGDPFSLRFDHTFHNVAAPAGHNIALAVQVDVGMLPTGYANTVLTALASFGPHDAFYTPHYFPYAVDGGGDLPNYSDFTIILNSAMPDMTLADMIKGMTSLMCLVVDTDDRNQVIELWYDEEYFRKPDPATSFRDWTDRIDHTNPVTKLREKLPRRIEYRFKEDKDDEELYALTSTTLAPGFANADVTLPDAYGDASQVNIPFTPSVSKEIFEGVVAPVLRDHGREFQTDDYGRTARIFVADGMREGNWKFQSLSQTEFPFAYFVTSETNGIPLHFANATAGYAGLIDTRHARRLLRMRTCQVLGADVFIRGSELPDFDLGEPTLADDGNGPCWFYVKEIRDHRMGLNAPTEVLLLQIDAGDQPAVPISDIEPEYPEIPDEEPDAPLPNLNGFDNGFSNGFE